MDGEFIALLDNGCVRLRNWCGQRKAKVLKIFFTIFQLIWAYIWATKHIAARRGRHYAEGRIQGDKNKSYKVLSTIAYGVQNGICVASFWSDASLLLKIHDSNLWRIVGVTIMAAATFLYFSALNYLGPNYSPCFDSYIPKNLVKDGPYQWIRHPMYFAKIMLSLGTFIISGSLLFVPIIAWLVVEVVRSISKEEKYLCLSLSNYVDYRAKTKIFVPWVF